MTSDNPAAPIGGQSRHRLPPQLDEWIDRTRPLRFRFEGSTYYGFAGDTISTALAANGVRLLGRSFKYHRPRGIYSLANHDVNVLVSDGRRTNLRADVTPLWEGAELTAVNTFGGLRDDLARHTDKAGRFLPVGFYYKTFHKPRGLFPFWERQMRAMAGLGAVDSHAPRLRTPKRYDWCDVLVVGAGPSGLSAAITAAERGQSVLLVDEQPRAGGSLHYQGELSASNAALRSLIEHAQGLASLRIATGTIAAGYYADHWVALVDDRRLTKLRARSVVLATGVFEQPALFRNNDLPGVMLASAAQRLTRQYSVKPFERPIVLAANSDGYRAALDMLHLGIDVRMLVDLRPEGERTELGRQVAQAGIEVNAGHAVYEALSGSDMIGINAAIICPLDDGRQPLPKHGRRIECDGLLMSVGWAPADSLFCQARGKMRYAPEVEQFVPGVLPAGVFTAGRLNGIYDLEDRLADGRRAGKDAADWIFTASAAESVSGSSTVGRPDADALVGSQSHERLALPRNPPSHPFPVIGHPAGKVFIDLDEDVQLKDIEHAVQEGFDGVELLKRYSTFGMGPSQGKIANTNTVRVLSRLRGEQMGENGSPTARPFFHPVPLAHLAGRGFHSRRETALHARHVAAGATFMPAGDWLRPAFYGSAADRDRAIMAEVEAVRQRVGLIDVSTLGKLEVAGADAAEFLERIYTGRFAKMKPGTTRYGLMCDESGVVIDDGVVGRLAEDRFYVTTTTSASGSVYREMQRWAILWQVDVTLANLTGVYAAMNLAGPLAPALLAELSDIDVSDSGFPYLALREANVLGAACRLLRTGFVGEVGYEIHAPAQSAIHLWDAIVQAGAKADLRPFGVEAQRVLRLEKGHVIVSQDTDGLTNPYEADLGWSVKDDKPFFVGGRSLRILAGKPLKRRLVGFALAADERGPLPSECHLVIDRGEIAGRVTSIAVSPTLGHAIGLAYVQPSQSSPGTRFQIRGHGGRMVEATVVELPFYDRAGARQKVRHSSPLSPGKSRVEEMSNVSQASGTWNAVPESDSPRANLLPEGEAVEAASTRLELTDVSARSRLTLKGPAVLELAERVELSVPEKIYDWRELPGGGLVIRTGRRELFLEDSPGGDTIGRMREVLAAPLPGVVPVWRQDVSLLFSGSEVHTLLAQVCNLNFAAAGNAFIMTQIAGVSCSVLSRRQNDLAAYQIWADGTYGAYLWTTLLAIARETVLDQSYFTKSAAPGRFPHSLPPDQSLPRRAL